MFIRAFVLMRNLWLLLFVVFAFSSDLWAQGEIPGDILYQPFVGHKKILFIRVKYPGDFEGVVSDSAAAQCAAVLKEIFQLNSYGKVNVSVTITPVLQMPQPASYYEAGHPLVRIRADAVALAEEAGFAVADYDREIIFTKRLWNSPAAGIGTINNRTTVQNNPSPYLAAHELGHSLGWRHASFWFVASGGSPISPNGRPINYGDPWDIMGDQIANRPRSFHHYSPWLKNRAGWIPDENILTVTQSGIYTLQAIERPPDAASPPAAYSALKIPKTPHRNYWIFYRHEELLAKDGAVIIWGFHSNTRRSYLLDMTPGSLPAGHPDPNADWEDAVLKVGQTFRDPDAGITVETMEISGDRLRVRVTVDTSAHLDTIDRLPVIDVVRPATGATISGRVEYEVTAYDPDEGTVNGAGIARVRLYLHPLDDPLISSLVTAFPSQAPPNPVAVRQFSTPPYIWSLDTADSLLAIPDAIYALVITAVSVNGDSNTVWFPHIIDNTGASFSTAVADGSPALPERFQLFQNYPNPFNPSTTIRFSLPHRAHVILNVFDLLGREVASLVDKELPAGEHTVVFDAGGLTSGVYLYRIRAGAYTRTLKAILIK